MHGDHAKLLPPRLALVIVRILYAVAECRHHDFVWLPIWAKDWSASGAHLFDLDLGYVHQQLGQDDPHLHLLQPCDATDHSTQRTPADVFFVTYNAESMGVPIFSCNL